MDIRAEVSLLNSLSDEEIKLALAIAAAGRRGFHFPIEIPGQVRPFKLA